MNSATTVALLLCVIVIFVSSVSAADLFARPQAPVQATPDFCGMCRSSCSQLPEPSHQQTCLDACNNSDFCKPAETMNDEMDLDTFIAAQALVSGCPNCIKTCLSKGKTTEECQTQCSFLCNTLLADDFEYDTDEEYENEDDFMSEAESHRPMSMCHNCLTIACRSDPVCKENCARMCR